MPNLNQHSHLKIDLIIFCMLVHFALSWNNLSCPAPRAPDNGLNFIFRSGELIQFRCHPGYVMRGKAVAHCVNNKWTNPPPKCVSFKRNSVSDQRSSDSGGSSRELFNWGAYGDGARRLPLINGIWPPQDHSVLNLAPSTPGPRIMVKEEIDIAELRHKQLEELKKQRIRRVKGKQKNPKKFHNPSHSKDNQSRKKNRRHRGNEIRYLQIDIVTSRKSRVGGSSNSFAQFRRRPVEEVRNDEASYDASCTSQYYGRALPKIAPEVQNAFVYAYETKKNKYYPFNTYMEVKYKCLTGFRFVETQTLFCKDQSWIGETPRCIPHS